MATVFAAIGAVAAAVAAVAALASLRVARDTLASARVTVEVAEQSRQDAERDRLRHRVERVGELAEELFWATTESMKCTPPDKTWMGTRNRLRHAVVGLEAYAPTCSQTSNAATAEQARGAASNVRAEVEAALTRLERG